jgi:hypothetical protein
MKKNFIRIYWLLSAQCGLDPLRLFQSLRVLPTVIRDCLKFRSAYNGKFTFVPSLHDRYSEGGETKSEYFWQDLLVARWIYEKAPEKHVDIGSRVDGFVAHVASFREIEVIDVRPVSAKIPGILFRQTDLMDPSSLPILDEGYCDSLSCLHALEHFGLGRYGDSINPLGYKLGLVNMIRLVKDGGSFYLSTPIGRERVEFNSNWVFDPRTIVVIAKDNGMELTSLTVFRNKTGLISVNHDDLTLRALAEEDYNLGIFSFRKRGHSVMNDTQSKYQHK